MSLKRPSRAKESEDLAANACRRLMAHAALAAGNWRAAAELFSEDIARCRQGLAEGREVTAGPSTSCYREVTCHFP